MTVSTCSAPIHLLGPGDDAFRQDIGGKALGLAALRRLDTPIPEWFVVPRPVLDAHADPLTQTVSTPLASALREATDELDDRDNATFAVRSSSPDEDGPTQSMAGQFSSFLHVPHDEVADRVAEVYATPPSSPSGDERSEDAARPAVIVQRMVPADRAGVAFSADPVTGRHDVAVVSAVAGTGDALVDGREEGVTVRCDRSGTLLDRDATGASDELDPELARRVAALARKAASVRGGAQDIEWAAAGDTLYLLQSRAITTLNDAPDPDATVRLWDNSNIAESYSGITTPLTYSFARRAYTAVYREFCRVIGVSESVIEENDDTFRSMIGLIRGRIYYDLRSWYRLVSLLPGFRFNRRFMEDMMGVRERLPGDLLQNDDPASWTERLRDIRNMTSSAMGLIRWHRRMDREVADFRRRLDRELKQVPEALGALRLDELADLYRSLEASLLTKWTAPIVNDFLTMIFSGLSKQAVDAWTGDPTLHSRLMTSTTPIISAEPVHRIRKMAKVAADDADLVRLLQSGDVDRALTVIRDHPELASHYDAYLDRFSDRCLGELKLESETVRDNPLPLLRAIGAQAQAMMDDPLDADSTSTADTVRDDANQALREAMRGKPVRRRVTEWLLDHARRRTADRETMRYDRTRVFGTVRRIVRAMGRRLAFQDVLDDPDDIFYLNIDELLGWIDGTASSPDLAALSATRRETFAGYRDAPAPPDRFRTYGAVGQSALTPSDPAPDASSASDAESDDVRRGLGCSPGIIRGRVRRATSPHDVSMDTADILVADRTDPGWVALFAACQGLIVAHGNQLSHAAIVAREMQLPTVVSIHDAMTWLEDGDLVEIDGQAGTVRKINDA